MDEHRRLRALVAGLLAGIALLSAACSDGPDSHRLMQPTTTPSSVTTEPTGPRVGDHAAEIAEYKEAAQAALPSRTGVVLGSSDIVTGADTPGGWQVQNQRGSFFGQDAAVGNRQVEVVCAGRGEVDVSVTVQTGQGDKVSTTPVSTTCSAQGSTSQARFEVGTDDEGFDVDVVPAGGAVAVLGWVVT
ncbi:hypothetical protein [Kineococcus sp. NPDC059986]|uniref:hypothetical protein n=1 Tax=Kineococcus sp. NPDC059986 TaxID=3155538 RepID=UPI00344BADCB